MSTAAHKICRSRHAALPRHAPAGRPRRRPEADTGDDTPVAGLRLTPVTSLTDAPSWSMLSTEMQRAVRAQLHYPHGAHPPPVLDDASVIWDLREVGTGGDRSTHPSHVAGAILELFAVGAGLIDALTPVAQRRHIRWVFTTTGPRRAALRGLGIPVTTLAQGRLRLSDVFKSCFCVLDPGAAIEHIDAHRRRLAFTFEHVETGLRTAELIGRGIAVGTKSLDTRPEHGTCADRAHG